MRGFRREAWVTGIISDNEVARALVLCESLKRTLTSRNIIAIVSSGISPKSRKALRLGFDYLFYIEEDEFKSATDRISRDQYFMLFVFTMKSFEKCIYLSSKLFAAQNCDEMFSIFDPSLELKNTNKNWKSFFVCLPNMDLTICLLRPFPQIFDSFLEDLRCKTTDRKSFGLYLKNWLSDNLDDDVKFDCIPDKYRMRLASPTGKLEPINDSWNCMDIFFVELDMETIYLESRLSNQVATKWKTVYEQSVCPLLEDKKPAYIPLSEKYKKEPIAIVGMSCRYPRSNNISEFWDTLFAGVDTATTPPDFRWTSDSSVRNPPDNRNTKAGFLSTPIDEFDCKFFGISNKDAIFMDPQQRLLLEIVWESLENAAIDPTNLRGCNGGVFTGSWVTDYRDILSHSGYTEFYREYMGTSIGACAARISYILGLTGPSIATESGCSSAMVAVHMACNSLMTGESNMALACGVNLLIHPFNKDEIPLALSPDGRCKTFSADANGFGRAEGCAVLVLKRMSDAVKDGNRILALLRGSAMTQEGITKCMGTPTVECESLAMSQALYNANVKPEEVSYVEAHGTGTVVGDPLEVSAIAKAYHSKKRKQPLVIGSVKTNLGHTEAVSGITGLIKVVLAMNNEIIPPHINFSTLNPDIKLDEVPAQIALQPVQWKRIKGETRYAGVSSFGISGTDVHVIVEETPEELLSISCQQSTVENLERPQHLIKMSAKSKEALELLLIQFCEHVKLSSEEDTLADIAFVANTGRASFQHRAVMIAKTKEDFVEKISTKFMQGAANMEDCGKICFLFPGQGSQYMGMAKSLYETSPIFKFEFNRCESFLRQQYNIRIKPVLSESTEINIGQTLYSQTSIFAVEYSLLKLWTSWGVLPDFVLGHSLGEFCAAVCAGILSLEDALKLVAERSLLIDKLPCGKMLVVQRDEANVTMLLKDFSAGDPSKILDIAAVNSPEQTVVAGDTETVLEFFNFLKGNGIKCIILDATHGFHSKHMDPILEPYRQVASNVKVVNKKKTTCQYISGLHGTLIDVSSIDSEYWVQHTRNAVNFFDASKKAVELGCKTFIEIGPQPVLLALIMMNCENTSKLMFLPSLKKNEDNWNTLHNSLGKLYLSGIKIDWMGYDRYYSRKKVLLPNYPFIRKKLWPSVMGVSGTSIHPILGSAIANASPLKLFDGGIYLSSSLEYLKDHAIGENVVFPGAGYLEMCLAAGVAVTEGYIASFSRPTRPFKVENLSIESPLLLQENSSVQVQTIMELSEDSETILQIKISQKVGSEKTAYKWWSHANATFHPLMTPEETRVENFSLGIVIKDSTKVVHSLQVKEIYDKLTSIGLVFGPTFRSIEMLWRYDSFNLVAKVKCPIEDPAFNKYVVHPVILDAMIQSIMMHIMLQENGQHKPYQKTLHVPIKIGKFVWLSDSHDNNYENIYIHVLQTSPDIKEDCRAILLDSKGTSLAIMSGVEVINTTVKAVESIIRQQNSTMPDLWEECWKKVTGFCEYRINLDLSKPHVYTNEIVSKLKALNENLTPRHVEISECLKEFAGLSMLNSLYKCGWQPSIGDMFFSNDLFIQLNIKEEHRMYFGFILDVLEEEGMLENVTEEKPFLPKSRKTNHHWRVSAVKHSPNALEKHLSSAMYLQQVTRSLKSAQVLVKISQSFADILQGNQNALPILFPEDKNSTISIASFYEEYGKLIGSEEFGRTGLEYRVQYLKELVSETRCVLRILEVGAGTGALTNLLLEVIDNLGVEYEYTYSDISAGFFSAAEKKFEKYASRMRFKKLNIEEDPLVQGFIPQYYDYIVASEVIHATKDICESLENVNLLLRPGGKLDLVETTTVTRYITFLVGLLPGYWRFQDLDLRPKHCTMPQEKWNWALHRTGFLVEKVFSFMMDQNSMICCQKMKQVNLRSNIQEKKKAWLVFHLESQIAITDNFNNRLKTLYRIQILVYPTQNERSKSITQDDEYVFKIREDSEDDFQWLLKQVSNYDNVIVEGILYCWAMNKQVTKQRQLLQPFFNLSKHIPRLLKSTQQTCLPRVLAITQGVVPIEDNDQSNFHASTIWGFCKSLRNELTELNCRCIDITDGDINSELRMEEIFSELFNTEKEPQIALHKRSKYIPKLCQYKISSIDHPLKLPSGTKRFQLVHPETRAIADLQFVPLDHFGLADNEIEVEVRYFGLNFRDVLNVLKPTKQFLQRDFDTVGFDFSGEVKRLGKEVTNRKVGELVFGVNFNCTALPSHVHLREDYVIPLPDHLTLAQAATLPVVFSTAYLCLVEVAKIKPTDIVLIHTGSGGVGHSAINICKHYGVTNIITTAGSQRKRNYLYNLGIQHVFNSRNTSFADDILRVTNGRGVDVVLNSLTGEGFKEASLRSCAKNAWFLEMSKINVWTKQEIKALRPDINYYIMDLDISTLQPEDWVRRLECVNKYFNHGRVSSPFPMVMFDATDIRQALVYLQKARQIGKVICSMPHWSRENGQLVAKIPMFKAENTYLITGGLGGIGFLVCCWMVEKGARNIILLGRNPPSDKVAHKISKLKNNGCRIEVVNLDIGDNQECLKLFGSTIPDMKLPPLRGIMHCAGTLNDGMIANQDWAKLSSVFKSKIDGTLNLHEFTKKEHLEHFVLFSSMTGLFGTPGQSNHSAASCFEDAFAYYRHSIGLPATTINWGPWSEVGVATEVDFPGIRPISNLQGLATLEHALKTHRIQLCAMNVDSFVLWSKLVPQLAVYLDGRVWNSSSSSTSFTVRSDEFWQEFNLKPSFDEKVQVVKCYCRKILSNVLRLEEGDNIKDDTDLQEMGVDSLMFVELKNALQVLLGDKVVINTNVLRDCSTINLISEALVKQIEGNTGSESSQPTEDQVKELEEKNN